MGRGLFRSPAGCGGVLQPLQLGLDDPQFVADVPAEHLYVDPVEFQELDQPRHLFAGIAECRGFPRRAFGRHGVRPGGVFFRTGDER